MGCISEYMHIYMCTPRTHQKYLYSFSHHHHHITAPTKPISLFSFFKYYRYLFIFIYIKYVKLALWLFIFYFYIERFAYLWLWFLFSRFLLLNLDFDFSGVSIGMECNGRECGVDGGRGLVPIDINETFTQIGRDMKWRVMVNTKHETNNRTNWIKEWARREKKVPNCQ